MTNKMAKTGITVTAMIPRMRNRIRVPLTTMECCDEDGEDVVGGVVVE